MLPSWYVLFWNTSSQLTNGTQRVFSTIKNITVHSHGLSHDNGTTVKPTAMVTFIWWVQESWDSRASIVCPPIRLFRPKLGEASEWNFVGSSPARSQLLKSRKHRGFSSRICKQYFSSQKSSVVIEWLGAHAIGYGPEFKADFRTTLSLIPKS